MTVVAVLLLCVCLYVSGLLVCMRADVASEASRRVHYVCDNSPGDSHLYAVTVHTGLQSAARMSAKVKSRLLQTTTKPAAFHIPTHLILYNRLLVSNMNSSHADRWNFDVLTRSTWCCTVKMASHRQQNYMSQDALCLGETLRISSYSG